MKPDSQKTSFLCILFPASSLINVMTLTCGETGCNSLPKQEPAGTAAHRGLHTCGQFSCHGQQCVTAQSCSPFALWGSYFGFSPLLSCQHFYDSNRSLVILEISFTCTLSSCSDTVNICICSVNNAIYSASNIYPCTPCNKKQNNNNQKTLIDGGRCLKAMHKLQDPLKLQ